jgi:uncharacterized NAD(P)/FAD-binding protein YdhS
MSSVVGIVGGGAAGVLAAMGFIQAAGQAASRHEIVIIDPRATLGEGAAYSTPQARHLLNVPAGRMGAFPHTSDGFVSWLRSHGHPEVEPTDFVARAWFGDYLAATFKQRVSASGISSKHLRDRVVRLSHTAAGIEITLGSRSVQTVDAAVLAIGRLGPRIAWAPDALLRSEKFVPDPWAPQALDQLQAASSILLVGTGLTMVDAALVLARRGRTLTAISRSARLPHTHRVNPAPPIPAPKHLAQSSDLAALRDAIINHLKRCNDQCGDWRPAFDGLRPVTADLWGRLTDEERARAIREMSSCWNRRRHRIAPQVSDEVKRLIASRQLRIKAGELRAASATDAGLRVGLSDGSVISVDAVVNCTGQETDPRRISDPLITGLFESGTARPGPIGLGLDTTGDGQILDRDGGTVPGLYTLGATRVGTLCESTAIPEIRAQASAVGAAVAYRLAPAGRSDQWGSPSTSSVRLVV